MTQQLLDGTHARFVPEHGRGTGVSERVAMDVLFELCLFSIFFNQHPDRIVIEPVAAGG